MKTILKTIGVKSKLARRFVFYVVSLGLVAALLLSLFISYKQYRDRCAYIKREVNNIISSNKYSIERSLWMCDTRTLDLIVQGFLFNRDIVFAQVTDEKGNTIVSKGRSVRADGIRKTVALYHQRGGKRIFLGKLTIVASRMSAFNKALSSTTMTLFQSTILMMIISVFVIWIFDHLVSRHLFTIQKYTKNVILGRHQQDLDLDRPINKHTRNDELASTVDAINFMRRNAEKAYQKLEYQMSERIKLERQLRQAQKMECIGRLAGGVAHDFNNILSVIIGYSELLLDLTPPSDPKHEQVKLIHDSGVKAAALTRQLLAFSRKQVLEKKVISINDIINNFIKIWGRIAGDDIVFTTYLSEENCTVEADPGQIEQIIMNLVVNARDAMPNGGEIVIETAGIEIDKLYIDKHTEVKPGQYVLLTISDTGEGMSEEVLEKIFDPFFTTKEQGKGTGLGLATIYGIVKQHGGYIFAYSEKDNGTIFKIYLPASDKTEQQEDLEFTSKALPQGNETILIVDDNNSICQLLVETLRPLGYDCLQATSGKDAIGMLREYRGDVHLLLTDVVMSGMNGRELSEIIRKERPNIKVIFMSGYTDNIIARHYVLEEGLNYIAKPITPVALAQKIRSVLSCLDDSSERAKQADVKRG